MLLILQLLIDLVIVDVVSYALTVGVIISVVSMFLFVVAVFIYLLTANVVIAIIYGIDNIATALLFTVILFFCGGGFMSNSEVHKRPSSIQLSSL